MYIHYVILVDFSLIEEAARLIIKRYKRTRFKELTNRREQQYQHVLHVL